jgi:MFS family permease
MVQWLVCIIAAIGFAFDTYALLMTPLIAPPALAELLHANPSTDVGRAEILRWSGYIMWGSALCGGVFGMLGGYLTDRLGRRRVLTWSILVYAVSSAAGAFVHSAEMLLFWRCLTFIGVCVEFVAAVAWLSELFPDPHRREAVLGYTQAFASVGGLLVAVSYKTCLALAGHLPAWLTLPNDAQAWRYALISGLIPALPLIVIRPFLPESPAWRQKKLAGTLQRPRFGELFQPMFRRTTIVTAILFACAYGAAFGAIQMQSQIVPGLIYVDAKTAESAPAAVAGPAANSPRKLMSAEIAGLRKKLAGAKKGTPEFTGFVAAIKTLTGEQQQIVADVGLFQEFGGLVGRFVLAWLALRIVGRQKLVRLFLVPGLLLIPLVFAIPAAGHLGEASLNVFKVGMFVTGFFTVAQFSFFGNYLPRMYPTHIRGTGESFAANVGGRMIGAGAFFVTTQLAAALPLIHQLPGTRNVAYAAAVVVLTVYAVGVVTSFWLPEPKSEALPE